MKRGKLYYWLQIILIQQQLAQLEKQRTPMCNKHKFAATAALSLAGLSAILLPAIAFDVISIDGVWTNITSTLPPNDVPCLDTSGNTPDNAEILYGAETFVFSGGQLAPNCNNPGNQSGFRIDDGPSQTVDFNENFITVQFTHINNPIFSFINPSPGVFQNVNLASADISSTIDIDGTPVTITFRAELEETPNNGTCAFGDNGDPQQCNDRVTVSVLTPNVEVGGRDNLVVAGFVENPSGNLADCDLDGTPSTEFITEEQTENSACIITRFIPIPETDDVSEPTQINPGGTSQVQVPDLSGDDTLDGTLGAGDTFKIVTLPSNGELFYNGSAVTVGQTITNYDPALLTLDPDDGAITVEFTYAAINSVGQEDPSPATVSVPFALPIPETDDINASSQSNPGGTTQVQVPNLSGSDPIDGTLGTGDSFKIVTLSNNGDLFYNGSAVTVGQTITNYDPALLTLDPDDGAITVEFTYAAINSVGQEDPSPATVSVPFALPIPETDLALSFDPLSAQPLQGFSFPVVLTVINEDPTIGANGVTVSLPIPNGYQYLSDDAAGGYDPDTGVWTIGNLPAGDSVDLTLNLAPLASGTYELEAEVSTLDETDTDSTPGNGVAGEDDIDTLEPTPTRGIGDTPPTLLCAPGFETLDWDLFSSTWIVSAPDQTVVGDRGTPIRVQFSGDIADMDSFDHALNNGFTGGLTPAEFSLRYFENFANRSQNVINTFDIGVPGIGVDELSFRIFDVDVLRSSGWADSLEVVGFLNGTSVLPTITSEGNSHSVSGNQVEGLINANNSTANGTVFVAFDSPIDRLVITTRPGNLTPGDNPGNQGVAIHDLSFCPSEDYGDAPDTYGTDITAGNSGSDPVGPSHTIASDLFFGASIPDAETNGFVDGTDDNGDATDDDDPVGTGTGNGDDEDGIAAFPTLTEGVNSYTIPASSIGVTNTSTEAATLHAWIDFNNSGTFEPAEYASVTVNSGTNGGNPAAALEWNGISVGSAGNTYARFRLTTDGSIDATTPGGAASDGEVEDYQVTIVTAPSTDFGDAPVTYDDTSGDGSIDGSDTPAEHAITNILNLGSVAPDDETAPQSSAAADGDDDATAPAIDDEDGVTVFPTIDSGATSYSLELSVNNDSGSAANVYAWIDFDLDGEFDEDERATVADGSIALSGGQVPTGSNGTVTLNWDNIGTTNDITNGDSFVRVRVTTDDLDITTETTGRDDAAVGSASDGEIEDFPLAIANAQVISPAAGDIVINEVLFRQTGSGAAGNDEFIELFNASNTPVDISGWQLLDGNLPANDTDGIGGINGNSGPFVFPAGTVVNPGAYVVVWVGTETPQKQADDAAFEFYLGQSSKLNNSGDDVWLYDADTAIVDYIAYGTNNGINTPPNAALNLWDDSFQSVIDNTSQVGQSISLTPNGQDGNISGCWEPTTSGDAETPSARCPGSLPTRDTDSVTDRITSVGVSNNGSPLILLVKRITAVNGIDIAGFDSNDGRTDDDDPNWPAPNSAFLRGAVSSGTVAPGDEVEFTIYFLSAGGSSVTNLTLCDLVPDNMTFVADAFQGQAPLDTNSLSGTDVGIALASDNTILPTAPTVYLTNVGEGDRGEFFPPNTAAPGTCNVADTSVSLPASSNLRGAVVVQVVDSSNTLPNATASGAPPDSYGFIRFRAIVD